ncbi:sulfurtransferase-like selenium metabolism protein YedF [Photobacterium sp. OFAV2-7]|uniref:sulfurtransferase-like selenium metabolism protein YedF n=1 Tax=Photobacterium sp. OFAV2-7 TaxID=2917748 RepID=UPI001EF57348|nr:sulfurtransferase-like selenium metabolism protein YedF [Photobacterium sp. OFAV2-7]MCG7586250.1 sulfurtransferase-like selenium metabolism protein YedF [Photobacterium sp. OFAV2-7]
MINKIDVRGVLQQQALNLVETVFEDQSHSNVEILSSDQAITTALIDNLIKKGLTVEEVLQTPEGQTIIASTGHKQAILPKSYVIENNTLGQGNEVIGQKLINAFFNVSSDYEQVPASIFFVNTGVKLCIDQADTVDALQKLQEKGTDIIVCGTCLDFFELKDKLAVGRIGTMHDLIGIYHGQNQVISL